MSREAIKLPLEIFSIKLTRSNDMNVIFFKGEMPEILRVVTITSPSRPLMCIKGRGEYSVAFSEGDPEYRKGNKYFTIEEIGSVEKFPQDLLGEFDRRIGTGNFDLKVADYFYKFRS